MKVEQQMIFQDHEFLVLQAEQEFIIHPSAFGKLPIKKSVLQQSFYCKYQVEEYHLILNKMECVEENNLTATAMKEDSTVEGLSLYYDGTILIGSNLVKEYYIKDQLAWFSYQNVYELVFDKGTLITTIDQSKAMLKVRKNIDTGLRSLNNRRDIRCINRFLHSALVGEYKEFILPVLRMSYLKAMKKDYQ